MKQTENREIPPRPEANSVRHMDAARHTDAAWHKDAARHKDAAWHKDAARHTDSLKRPRTDFSRVLTVGIFLTILFSVPILFFVLPTEEVSVSERRRLAEFPNMTMKSVLSGSFFRAFDPYTADQFPFRECARSAKAVFRYYVLKRLENHGIYYSGDSAVKREDRFSAPILEKNIEVWNRLAEEVFPDAEIYYSLIPDKNYFGFAPKADYGTIDDIIARKVSARFRNIPLFDPSGGVNRVINLDDYYKTDLHWKHESVHLVAERIANALGTRIDPEECYRSERIGTLFGAYAGQSALPSDGDPLVICRSDTTDAAEVHLLELQGNSDIPVRIPGFVYDIERRSDADAYSVYLSGPQAAIEIINRNRDEGKTLLVFRDSFASSLIPYLISGYRAVYVMDLRYLSSGLVANFCPENVDEVLFLYSVGSISNLPMK